MRKMQSSRGAGSDPKLTVRRSNILSAGGCHSEPLEARLFLSRTLGGGTDDPLSVVIGATGAMQVFFGGFETGHFYTPGTADPELPGDAGIFVRESNGTVNGFPYPFDPPSVFMGVSQSTGTRVDGTEFLDQTLDAVDGNINVNQEYTYVPGTDYFRVDNTVNNLTGQNISFDFFAAADLFLAGSDSGTSFFDPATGAIGGHDANMQYSLSLQPSTSTPAPTHHEAGGFSEIFQAINSNSPAMNFNDQANPTANDEPADNAIGLQWSSGPVTPESPAHFSYYVTFSTVDETPPAPVAPPTAQIGAAPNRRDPADPSPYQFTIDYSPDVDIDSLGNDDIDVTGPGYFAEAQEVGEPLFVEPGDAAERPFQEAVEVTYTIPTPPSDGSSPAQFISGVYTIAAEAHGSVPNSGVLNRDGVPLADGNLGTFEIGPARLSITPEASATALQTALFPNGGVTFTGDPALLAPPTTTAPSTGTFTTSGEVYGITSTGGIVMSTGDVRSYESGGDTGSQTSTAFGTDSSPGQEQALHAISPDADDFHDVSQLTFHADAGDGVTEVAFSVVFGTEELNATPDAFGIFVNGDFAHPVAALSAADPDGELQSVSGTALNKVILHDGSTQLTFNAPVHAGSNTFTIILADANDDAVDSTAFISAAAGKPKPIASFDETLGGSSGVQGGIIAEAVQTVNGKLYSAGFQTNSSGISRWVIQRFDADGNLDRDSFGVNGTITTTVPGAGGRITDMVVDSSGEIFVCGDFNGAMALAAYNSAGPDTSFGTGGRVLLTDGIDEDASSPSDTNGDTTDGNLVHLTKGQANALTFDGDKLVVVGSALISRDTPDPLFKIDRDVVVGEFSKAGAPVGTFGVGPNGQLGVVSTEAGRNDAGGAVAIQPDGKIVVAGNADQRVVVIRYNPDGTLDLPFGAGRNPDGKRFLTGTSTPKVDLLKTIDSSVGLALETEDGMTKILVAAAAGGDSGPNLLGSDFGVVRLNSNGLRDGLHFGGGDALATTDFGGTEDADSVVVFDGSTIGVTGNVIALTGTRVVGNQISSAVALYTDDGMPLTGFGAGGSSYFDSVTVPGGPGSPGTVSPLAINISGFVQHLKAAKDGNSLTLPTPVADESDGSKIRRLIIDRTAPLASLATPSAVTSGGGTSKSLVVTFTDDVAVDASDIDANTISVTRDETSEALPVTVSLDSPNDGATRVATYTITPPGGTWDFTDSGNYTVTLRGSRVSDTSGNTISEMTLGHFAVNIADPTAPTAAFPPATDPAADATTYTFTVQYASPTSVINVSSIDTNDITVTGPNGPLVVQSAVPDLQSNGSPVTVTYTVAASDGLMLSTAGTGTYTIALAANQVADAAGTPKFVAANPTLGTFTVTAPSVPLAKKTVIMMPDGTVVTASIKGGTGTYQMIGSALSFNLTTVSGLALKTKGGSGAVQIHDITATGFLSTLSAKTATLTGTLSIAGGIGKITLAAMSGATVSAQGITSIKITGAVNGSTIRSSGFIGKVAVGSMSASNLFAGVATDLVNALPADGSSFVNGGALIKSLAVTGPFAASFVAAPSIGKVTLGSVAVANAGTAFGIASGAVVGLRVRDGSVAAAKGLVEPSQSITTGDFNVRIF